MKKKFILFFCFLVVSLLLCVILVNLYMYFFKGVLYFNSFLFAFISSLISVLFWLYFCKDKFESFLVFCTFFFICLIFVYLAPVTLDRSLSAFVYFYSVENEEINRKIYQKEYFDEYIDRRFVDAEKIGFLKCNQERCIPTLKAKLLYYSLYPFGKATKTLSEYEKFKEMLNNSKN